MDSWEVLQGLEPAGEAAPEGGDGATSVCCDYRAVVQTVLLFGAETWVLSEAISRELGGLPWFS